MRPTADHIARAIVAAARETGANPLSVASGELDAQGGRAFDGWIRSRARAYAGEALRRLFKDRSMTDLARFVGVSKQVAGAYFSSLDQRRQRPAGTPWWDDAALARVMAAVDVEEPDTTPRTSSPHYYEPKKRPEPKPEPFMIDEMTGRRRLTAGYPARPGAGSMQEKGDDFLRRAVENTAKLQERK